MKPESDAVCPTCGPTGTEQHPRRSGVARCVNCKEWLRVTPPACPCGCPADMHIGEIGCPCALPGEPPCVPSTSPVRDNGLSGVECVEHGKNCDGSTSDCEPSTPPAGSDQ